jgi:hypothetical protein
MITDKVNKIKRKNGKNNEIWRVDSDWLMAYTECPETIPNIKRSYPDFTIAAEYFKHGKLFALQYKIPSNRKRSARHAFGVDVTK